MSHKDENLEFNYINSVPDTSTFVYYPDPTYHPFSEPDPHSFSHFNSNYQSPYRNAKPDKQQYSQPSCQMMFPSETFVPGPKSYTRTFSGNDLLTSNSSSTKCIRRQNSDIPGFCDFGTYDPFQGSPLEITNLSLHENRPIQNQVHTVSEAFREPEHSASQKPEAAPSKRSYKDVLTIPLNHEAANINTETIKSKIDNEIKKESYKDKLMTIKTDPVPSGTKTPPTKSNLNNHQSQPNSNPKKPVKINNNLSGSAKKGNGKFLDKNLHSVNESVRSVRSQTDVTGFKKRNRPSSVVENSPSFELPPSEDEVVTPVEIRIKDKAKENKNRSKVKERDVERPGRKHHKRNPPTGNSSTLAQAYFPKIVRFCSWFFWWLYNLCADVIHMSCDLSWHGLQHSRTVMWEKGLFLMDWVSTQSRKGYRHVRQQWIPPVVEFFRSFRRNSSSSGSSDSASSGGLSSNIPLPSTGDEAMHRLLACKGRDPYSILGVRRDSSDEEIRRYYKRQAVLVHPDKNRQRGAEEAFKILAHAFELIGSPEQRARYDQLVQEAVEMESAWAELNELLSRLHTKMDEAANTIRCTNCAKRHRRTKTERPCYAARYCQDCKIHHSAREGDLWAESRLMGFRSNYYACMEGAVYDITEWANCQVGHLRHLQSNSHRVQYRIVPGQGLPTQGFGRNKSS